LTVLEWRPLDVSVLDGLDRSPRRRRGRAKFGITIIKGKNDMNLRRITVALLYAFGFALLSNSAIAQKHDHDHEGHGDHDHDHGDKADAGGMPEMNPAEMEAWMAYATPGKQHEHLQHFVGEWNWASKFWMAPGAPPMEGTGVSTVKPVFEGRFVMDEVKALTGMPFEGLGITGFDNASKKFQSVWFDSMGTALMFSEGTGDESGKNFTFFGSYTDPIEGVKKMRNDYKIVNDDKHLITMHEIKPDGTEFKSFELVVTRR
jgi:hypothetical protein